ncbi:Ycf66 family protein [Cyanobium sp. WAJ14-Wanaka]|uniref:Ycf66 family protein n=1 Tax=Cyanobium sp. WAJ14-Wanaka TaxID=2823725 RepID=UPI0020CECEE7|nr:Ycf66 family protein [Cyanobium sp. WAJ14-Wanaka]MCP9776122.1 hypothetical protein [Cyanobium sp. WAJ14-Wanaka]
MVNASLNWASIVGIVLAVGGALLYFMRSFKPALARDYDVFFAAVGLLCGGILFFQGWRLDPILQFGQFLLAGTTVFFAYESVRLRGVTTEQARRSSYFDDEEPIPAGPNRPRMGGRSWGESEYERLDEPQPLRRRIPSREEEEGGEEDFYRPRRPSRAAIPERAASRRPSEPEDWSTSEPPSDRSRYRAGAGNGPATPDFGARRRDRQEGMETRRGSRPSPSAVGPGSTGPSSSGSSRPGAMPQGTPVRGGRPSSPAAGDISDADFSPIRSSRAPQGAPPAGTPAAPSAGPSPGTAPESRPRDNSSRFDD